MHAVIIRPILRIRRINSSPVSFHIREATNADAGGIVEVVRAVYDEYGFTWDAEEYHADLYEPEAHYDKFFVVEDGGICGVIGLCFHDTIPGVVGEAVMHEGRVRAAGSDCSLERLYVHPDARRRGIGEALTCEVIERAKAAGKSAMELWSDKRFGDAHRLYGRFGAVAIGDRICHDPDQSPEWGLVIVL
jgi:putative acetyltransferase